ncbi:unnamed protein product, partial [Rotaria magnacalcarata]
VLKVLPHHHHQQTLALLNLEWSQLHLMITRSTTPDRIKMAMKLTESFNAQLLN